MGDIDSVWPVADVFEVDLPHVRACDPVADGRRDAQLFLRERQTFVSLSEQRASFARRRPETVSNGRFLSAHAVELRHVAKSATFELAPCLSLARAGDTARERTEALPLRLPS